MSQSRRQNSITHTLHLASSLILPQVTYGWHGGCASGRRRVHEAFPSLFARNFLFFLDFTSGLGSTKHAGVVFRIMIKNDEFELKTNQKAMMKSRNTMSKITLVRTTQTTGSFKYDTMIHNAVQTNIGEQG